MRVLAVVDEGLGNSSYVVDLGDGGALIVDPWRSPAPYLERLQQSGLAPRFVAETHLHADFITGGREMASLGAEVLAPRQSRLRADHVPLDDDQEVDLGGPTLRAIATPGHTPEHLSYLLLDGDEPLAVFSGGTLIAGGVARPDLIGPEQTEPLARDAYRSIRERLMALPDDLVVYPTHGAGSFCSTNSADGRTTTIGRERSANPLLADDLDEDRFVEMLLAGLGSFPPYFLELRDVNRMGPTVVGPSGAELPPVTANRVARLQSNGAEVVDVRSIEQFASGHVPGALSNPWRAQFATWLGWLVDRRTPVVFVVDDRVDLNQLTWECLNVGVEVLVGYLDGGMRAWSDAGFPTATTRLLGPHEVARHRIVDVRQASEYEDGHVPGALNVELGSILERAEDLAGFPVLVHCGHGERAMTAASLLQREGHRQVAVLAGGPDELVAARSSRPAR